MNMKKIYQPLYYYDDGTNIGWEMPRELNSFDAFESEDDCICWLENNGYDIEDFSIDEYDEEDIEDYTLLDCDGNPIE